MSMASPPLQSSSREATPSSTTSNSLEHASVGSTQGSTAQSQEQEDVERFLKRMDMEKKMQILQQRLELASVKATNGWTDMSIGEIESKLPPPSPSSPSSSRRRSVINSINGIPGMDGIIPSNSYYSNRIEPYPTSSSSSVYHRRSQSQNRSSYSQSTSPIITVPSPIASSSTSGNTVYEPPSPSRPWQLIDVLWQPLPPPSNPSPKLAQFGSPRKKTRTESMNHPHPHLPTLVNGVSGHNDGYRSLNGHRRSSSSAQVYFQEKMKKERRSMSQSLNTNQDVDAANALAFMHADSIRPSASTPTPSTPPPRPRAHSMAITPDRTPRSATRTTNETPPEEHQAADDQSAAEAMVLFAHSPSPLRKVTHSPVRGSPGTARVLFGESERIGKSNLALAPPITAGQEPRGEFGGFL